MRRSVLGALLALVVVAAAVACATILLDWPSPSVTSGRVVATALVVLAGALFGLAAAQAWDRGSRAWALFAILGQDATAGLFLFAVWRSSIEPPLWRLVASSATVAIFGTFGAGLSVVGAPRRAAWIGNAALACVGAVCLGTVVEIWSDSSFLSKALTVAMVLAGGLTAALSIRARLAHAPGRCPTCGRGAEAHAAPSEAAPGVPVG